MNRKICVEQSLVQVWWWLYFYGGVTGWQGNISCYGISWRRVAGKNAWNGLSEISLEADHLSPCFMGELTSDRQELQWFLTIPFPCFLFQVMPVTKRECSGMRVEVLVIFIKIHIKYIYFWVCFIRNTAFTVPLMRKPRSLGMFDN